MTIPADHGEPTPAPAGGDGGGGPAVVVPRCDGPLLVEGPVVLTAPDGSTTVHDRLFLCRCGHSGDKPLCDGTHKRIGFSAPGRPPTSRRRGQASGPGQAVAADQPSSDDQPG